MIRFRYTAIDRSGQTCQGELSAQTPQAARADLRASGMLPLTLGPKRGWSVSRALPSLQRKALSRAEQTVFARQMATLLSNGVQIEAALAAIAQQASARLATQCSDLRREVLDGKSFSAALARAGTGFDRFFLTSVEAADHTGQHGQVLSYLADHAEDRQSNQQAVLLALIYPAILIVVSVAVIIGLLVFLLPDIVRVFAARGADLPALTKLLISLSDSLTAYGPAIAALAIALLALGYLAQRDTRVLSKRDALVWRIGLTRQFTTVQFTRTLATLTQSGVVLADALPSAGATVGNAFARDLLAEVSRNVRDGMPLSRALARTNAFPPTMITMIASGEASGTLPAMLDRFAKAQAISLQAKIKTFVGLVEPLVLLVMGGVVMLLVLAILLPIVTLNALVG